MKIAIVGLGLIGQNRVLDILELSKENPDLKISSVYDIKPEVAFNVKQKYNVPVAYNLDDIFNSNPDWVFVVTPNDVVPGIVKKCYSNGCNVLVEKPFGRSFHECEEIISLKPDNKELYVGFNYRFFAGIEHALADVRANKFGKLISVNIILGHGNSPGMLESSSAWKLDPIICGGVFTDLGVHCIDLMTQITNSPITIDCAKQWKGYWNTGIDEETHVLASDSNGVIFNIQTSLNRWRSNFKLEINGTEGYGVVEGRGRSYGPQSYRIGKRWGWSGTNKTQTETEEVIVNKDPCTDSFTKEIASVLKLNTTKYNSLSKACTFENGANIMKIYDQCKEKLK